MTLPEGNRTNMNWTYGAVPLARDEIHDEVIEMTDKEPRGKVLDVPTGAGILAEWLRKTGTLPIKRNYER